MLTKLFAILARFYLQSLQSVSFAARDLVVVLVLVSAQWQGLDFFVCLVAVFAIIFSLFGVCRVDFFAPTSD